jgi:DNA ligase-1
MLAFPYNPDKHENIVSGWWISEKYDGVRAKWNGTQMESRTGHIYTLPDFLAKQLRMMKDEDGNPIKLDGELWGGYDTFAYMSGLARRQENDPNMWTDVNYMIFDTPDENLIFEERITKLVKIINNFDVLDITLPNIKMVWYFKFDPTKMVKYPHSSTHVQMNIADELKKIEDVGGEGLVLRKPASLYVHKRSTDMLKVKSWSYKEGIVTGYVEGVGKYTDMVGSLTVKSNEFDDDEKWVSFKVGSGLNDIQRYSGDTALNLNGKTVNWKLPETQKKIDELRKLKNATFKSTFKSTIDNQIYKNIVNKIKTSTGKERIDALHNLNIIFTELPLIGSVITFRFKELTKDGNPSMPTFVGVRNYE